MEVDPVVALLLECGGSATWARLRAELPRRGIERAVRAGLVTRVARGAFVLPDATELAAALAVGGVVSHESAAALWSLETLTVPTTVHVTVPSAGHAGRRRGVRVHWADLRPDEVEGRVTRPLRTVLDCARTLPFADALAVADSALRRGVVTRGELVAGADVSQGWGAEHARRVAGAADGRAANPFESCLRAVVLEAGARGFVPQLPVLVAGRQSYLDLADPRRTVALEADSFAFHGTRSALDRDCRRYDELVRNGWLVLRFSWEQVMFDRAWVGQVVRDTAALRTPAQRAQRADDSAHPAPRGHPAGTSPRAVLGRGGQAGARAGRGSQTRAGRAPARG